jgi:hypothetical protein
VTTSLTLSDLSTHTDNARRALLKLADTVAHLPEGSLREEANDNLVQAASELYWIGVHVDELANPA